MKNKPLKLVVLVVVLLAIGFALVPAGGDAVAWTPSPAQPLEGAYAHNDLLKAIQPFDVDLDSGPAAIVIDAVARIYVGYANGRIVRLDNDGKTYVEIAKLEGRPMAMSFDPTGELSAVDSTMGPVHLDFSGEATRYALRLDPPVKAATDIERGKHTLDIYFTDASTRFGADQLAADLLDHHPSGRLLSFNVQTRKTRLLMEGLAHPDGLTLGPNDAYVLVSEAAASRITRYWLGGEKAGTHDVFADNLPGLPGDLSFNGTDRFWVTIPKLRSAWIERLAGWPRLRAMLARLPPALLSWLHAADDAGSFVLGYDLEGKLVANLQYHGPDGFGAISNVEETGPWLIFGSREGRALGRFALHSVFANVSAPPTDSEQIARRPTATVRHDAANEQTDNHPVGTSAD